MSKATLKKTTMSLAETTQTDASAAVKKPWKSPELTEVDYDKTNTGFSGTGLDFSFYS